MSAIFSINKQQTSSFQSDIATVMANQYSITLNFKGAAFNLDVVLETRTGESDWVEITDTARAGVTGTDETKHYDINLGKHWQVRANVTMNSGKVDLTAYVSK